MLSFFLGGGAVVALVLGLTGLAPRALLLASLLWVLFGMLTGVVDLLLAPLAELAGGVLAGAGLARAAPDRLGEVLQRVALLDGAEGQPALAAAELERFRRDAGLLAAGEDIRLGLRLASLYEQRLGDPGRALRELRRLIDLHPHLRETVALRARLSELQARHPQGGAR